ncbi:MAG TPA: flagellar biosynthesis anti-sigma factor FlgM [Nitrospirae bacterium]|nr:flagellar biosynthesis anti-sigma factor FlgM [Nitrospirota bacterium]
MKINGGKLPEGQEAYLRTEKTQGKEAINQTDKTRQKNSIQDRVELSGKAKELDALKKAINELPEIREKRVEEIRQAIETGNYRIDPFKVAGKILEEL